jgi:hypothetical protein
MGIIFLVGAAYLADKFEKPLEMALVYVGIGAILGLTTGNPIGEVLIHAVLMLAFCLAYFFILIRVSDQLALWLLVLISFPLALFLYPIVFTLN